ncbi:hypothetical protein M011DRAFT_406845 [Sporormia fimetaria CBS 119925]|uniref:RRM domain-containing protein n=1 Tax=Sporormia fimetaria CBS 119925 TaxID=1340428 RepID=A0A6A6V6Y7_9PLEO|nr:hypothetical protein M011DRAFT_406845 [Sporormia fimetaria CBS 119925]
MSRSTQSPPAEDTWEVRKEEKKRKKSSKDKADGKRKKDAASDESPSKKRKREVLPEELEIDVSLPEPASRKEARKAKKAKPTPKPATEGATGDESATKPKAGATEEEKKAGQHSEYGVWIGNLPWSATKDTLRTFLTTNSDITSEQITRVHMPAPSKPPNPNWTTKPLNRGFAYVDFSDQLSMFAAIALTETKLDGRPLLIKNAKSFEGRPEKPKSEAVSTEGGKKGATGHPPNKRVFVGNLAFDVTKEDLSEHYGQCGEIADLHMATFEDSGKCKGYAWVTFEDVESATSAVKGYIFKEPKKSADDSEDDDAKKSKKIKWFVNRLMGRELRCEFAEDSTTRYNKRYGKEKKEGMEGIHPDRMRRIDEGDGPKRRQPRAPGRKVDPRSIRPGAAHTNAQRGPQGIVEATGTKIQFD